MKNVGVVSQRVGASVGGDIICVSRNSIHMTLQMTPLIPTPTAPTPWFSPGGPRDQERAIFISIKYRNCIFYSVS